MSHHKCIACRKGWVNKGLAERRVQYATTMLQSYPEPKDWQRVRFSDDVHFGWGPEGAIRISYALKGVTHGKSYTQKRIPFKRSYKRQKLNTERNYSERSLGGK